MIMRLFSVWQRESHSRRFYIWWRYYIAKVNVNDLICAMKSIRILKNDYSAIFLFHISRYENNEFPKLALFKVRCMHALMAVLEGQNNFTLHWFLPAKLSNLLFVIWTYPSPTKQTG
jgi:hypothetical protein